MRQGQDVIKTAIIGLGQMGRGIGRNLDANALLCAGFDTDEGAFAAAGFSDRVNEFSRDQLIDVADILVFAVPSTAEIEAFFNVASGRSGQVVIDLTTSAPKHSRALAGRLAKQGFTTSTTP